MKYGNRRSRRWKANHFPSGSRNRPVRNVSGPRVRFFFNGIEIPEFAALGGFMEFPLDSETLVHSKGDQKMGSEEDKKRISGFLGFPEMTFAPLSWEDSSRQRPDRPDRDAKDVALEMAKEKIAAQDAFLKRLASAAHMIGTVVDIRGDRMTIVAGGQYDVALFRGAKIGDVITIVAESMQVIGVLHGVTPPGVIATVQQILPDGRVEIEFGGPRILRTTVKVDIGDRVFTDQSISVILENLGKPKSLLAFEKTTGITWDDVGGHEEAKRVLVDAIETPKLHADLFVRYGRKPTKGVLLYGPPGTGKTLLAKAAATSLAKTYGHDISPGFIYVKGPALLSKWVGESESSVRAIFAAARAHKAEHGYPALVFIDEAEAILGRRGGSHGHIMTQTLVPQFLAEMDGLEDSGALVLLATNRPGDLDPAITREGRIDRKVMIGRPQKADTERIAAIHLKGKPVSAETDLSSLAAVIAEAVHGDEIGAVNLPSLTIPIFLASFSSGAMVAGIVEAAAEKAFSRDLAAGTFSGITAEDAKEAVLMIRNGLVGLDPQEVAKQLFAENQAAIMASLGASASADDAKVDLHKVSAKVSN